MNELLEQAIQVARQALGAAQDYRREVLEDIARYSPTPGEMPDYRQDLELVDEEISLHRRRLSALYRQREAT